MSFLNRANFEYVFDLAFQYLQDTNSLFVTTDELQKMVADTMMGLAKEKEKEEVNLESWNRQTIRMVRDAVRKRAPVTEPVAPVDEVDPFFIKLQELEVSRKTGNVWMTAAAPAAPVTPAPVVTETNTVPSVTTIYMQAPVEKGVPIQIRSWHRSWVQRPERSKYIWNGPIPNGINLLSTYVSCVIVPKMTMTFTPYVILEIEGAGGQVSECVLVPDSRSVNATWEYLRPSSKSLAYLRPLALPWTLRFLDADREPIPFGKDYWAVRSVEKVRSGVYRLTVHHGDKADGLSHDFVNGEWILLEANADKQARCKVLTVGLDTIDVHSNDQIDTSYTGANILHLHRQTSVILNGMLGTTHAKK